VRVGDGNHARADAYVSLAVIATTAVVAIGLPVGDPLIGMGITVGSCASPGSRGPPCAVTVTRRARPPTQGVTE